MNNPMGRGARFSELHERVRLLDRPLHVPVLEEVSLRDFFRSYAPLSRPFILQIDSVDGEAALRRIENDFGEKKIKVRLGDYADPEKYAPERRVLEEMTIARYLADQRSGRVCGNDLPPYAGNFSVPVDFLDSIGIGTPVFYPSSTFEPPTVWLGSAGSITPLHRDSTDNFTYQLVGKKRWRIFSPLDNASLYMNHVAASVGGDFATSSVDLRRPDLEKFPLFSQARSIEFTVDAGQMLYLPMGWAHFVENISNSLMVNYWRSPKPSGIGALE